MLLHLTQLHRRWLRGLGLVAVTVALLSACTSTQVAEVLRQHHVPPTPPVVNAIVRQQNDAGAQFLRLAAALHNEPFLACTRAHESDTAGGYAAYNPEGPYFGAFQYLQGTWNTAVVHYGNWFPELIGADIRRVMPFFQDLVTWRFYLAVGNGPWAGRC